MEGKVYLIFGGNWGVNADTSCKKQKIILVIRKKKLLLQSLSGMLRIGPIAQLVRASDS